MKHLNIDLDINLNQNCKIDRGFEKAKLIKKWEKRAKSVFNTTQVDLYQFD